MFLCQPTSHFMPQKHVSSSFKRFLLASSIFAFVVILTTAVSFAVIRPTSPAAVSSVSIQGLLNFTNKNRSTPLVLDERLNRSAQAKCQDMVSRNYYDHNAPDGTTPWVFIHKEIGYIPGGTWGENISYNASDSKIAVDDWMTSPKHRENIQNPAYHTVGFGICTTNTDPVYPNMTIDIIVQHFAS